MRLAEYVFTYGHVPMMWCYDGDLVIFDCSPRRNNPLRHNDILWELHHLSDYVVSSSQGGWLYRLIKREGTV